MSRACFADSESEFSENFYKPVKLPLDVGEYSHDVLHLKRLVSEIDEYYRDTEGFEGGMMYTDMFAEEVKRLRVIFNLPVTTGFDRELYERVTKELKLRKKT